MKKRKQNPKERERERERKQTGIIVLQNNQPVVGRQRFFAVVRVGKGGPELVPKQIVIGPLLECSPEAVHGFVVLLDSHTHPHGKQSCVFFLGGG